MRRRLSLLASVALLVSPVGVAWSQDDVAADSTAALSPLEQASRDARTGTAAADTTAVPLVVPFFWFKAPSVGFGVDVRADVSQVRVSGNVDASVPMLGGYVANTMLTQSTSTFRQFDREIVLRGFDAGIRGGQNRWAAINLGLSRNTSEDVNVVAGNDIVIDSDDQRGSLTLDGKQRLPGGIKWVLTGSVLDVTGNNRGTNNDRQLAEGGLTTRWKHGFGEQTTVSARYGSKRASGTRQLRGQEIDATTAQDSVGTTFEYTLGTPLAVAVDLDRIWFDETRLDFRRNADGAIDTLNIADDELRVAQENELRTSDRLAVRADARPLPVLGIGGTYTREFNETSYAFSQEGVLLNGGDRLDVDMDFRYAEAGSLQVRYAWSDSWNDRRTRGATRSRGRDNRVSREAILEFFQKVYRQSDLELKFSQRLSQSIFGEVANKNDQDQLEERADAILRSKAIPRVVMNLGGTLRRADFVSIDSERVGLNKEDRLFEVTGSYNVQASDRVSFDQSVKMQIVFNDFHNSNDRDQYNKQGQMITGAALDIAPESKFTADYTIDFRSSGKRVDDGRRRVQAYQTSLRSFDHQLRVSLTFPLPLIKVTLNTQRGFLQRENPSVRTGSRTEEERGEFRAVFAGGRKFLNDRLDFRVDVTRVLAYGPRVREENADYWIANSGFSMRF